MKAVWIRTTVAVTVSALVIVGVAPAVALAAPRDAATAAHTTSTSDSESAAKRECVSVRPVTEFYAGGRKASFPLTVPSSACSTISVSHIKDAANSADRCQTFLVGFFPADGSEATYTEPVTACAVPPRTRTVLASNVPDGTIYRILYNIDYFEPTSQTVRYKAWH
jgi:hypothetical protein